MDRLRESKDVQGHFGSDILVGLYADYGTFKSIDT